MHSWNGMHSLWGAILIPAIPQLVNQRLFSLVDNLYLLNVQKVEIAALWKKKIPYLWQNQKRWKTLVEFLQKWEMKEILFPSELLSMKIFCSFMGEKKNQVFPPEGTMTLLALKHSNGQESPSQKLPISSSFLFWKNIIFAPYENNIDPKKIAWKNFDFVRVQVKFKFRFASLRPPFAFLLLYLYVTLSLNSVFFCV